MRDPLILRVSSMRMSPSIELSTALDTAHSPCMLMELPKRQKPLQDAVEPNNPNEETEILEEVNDSEIDRDPPSDGPAEAEIEREIPLSVDSD